MVQGGKDVFRCIRERPYSTHHHHHHCHHGPRWSTSRRSSSARPISNSKYSTVNYLSKSPSVSLRRDVRHQSVGRSNHVICNHFQHQSDRANQLIYSNSNNNNNNTEQNNNQQSCNNNNNNNNNKSRWEKCTTSSCLVGFMKFIQHQCHPKRKNDIVEQPVLIIHEDVVAAMKQLKCDIERFTDIERETCGTFNVDKIDGETPKKILTRMAFKVYEIEDRLLRPNVPTCGEILSKRKTMLNLIKTIQKTIGCYLESEVEALKERQAKLCNLLRCLQCIETEFRCMTKRIKDQCCSKNDEEIDKCMIEQQSNNLSLEKKKSFTKLKDSCVNTNTTSLKDYELSGVDLIYTKSRIETLETDNKDKKLPPTITEEECINDKIACHLPVDGGKPICEVQIRSGNQVYKLCDSPQLKQTICKMSDVWHESARQLLSAFNSC